MGMGGNKSEGFTIVETLIVLAVSAIVAASTMILISGRQNKTEFMVATNNLKQHLEQVINETRNGYYPGAGDFSCNGSGGTVVISPLNKNQGTNNSCIFLGKAIEFGADKSGASTEASATYPLVGVRQVNVAGSMQEVSSYAAAKAIALAPGSSTNNTIGFPDHSEFTKTQNGLSLNKATYYLTGGGVVTTSGYAVFAVTDNLKGYVPNATTGELDSGLEQLNLYYFGSTPNWPSAPSNSAAVVDGINTRQVFDSPPAGQDLKSVDLCFDGLVPNQTATISITGLGQLSVKLKISNSPC